jgi:hypothetical protein
MYSEAERRLRPLLGPDIFTHRGKYVTLFRLPDWKHDDFIFGIYFGMDLDPTKRLISEPGSGPWAGIGVLRTDDSSESKGCQEIVSSLSHVLKKTWPHEKDLRDPDETMALWREMRIPDDGEIERWAEDTIEFLEELASRLAPTLKNMAKRYNK